MQAVPPRPQGCWKGQGSEMLPASLTAWPGTTICPDSGVQRPACQAPDRTRLKKSLQLTTKNTEGHVMGVLPEPACPITPAKSSRASMCSECSPQAWLFRGPAGSSEKHQAHPTVTDPHPCQTPPQESWVLALRAAIHLNPSSHLRASAASAASAATC